MFALISVDDILDTGFNSKLISKIIFTLSSIFVIKYLGPLHYFLGIEVTLIG